MEIAQFVIPLQSCLLSNFSFSCFQGIEELKQCNLSEQSLIEKVPTDLTKSNDVVASIRLSFCPAFNL